MGGGEVGDMGHGFTLPRGAGERRTGNRLVTEYLGGGGGVGRHGPLGGLHYLGDTGNWLQGGGARRGRGERHVSQWGYTTWGTQVTEWLQGEG